MLTVLGSAALNTLCSLYSQSNELVQVHTNTEPEGVAPVLGCAVGIKIPSKPIIQALMDLEQISILTYYLPYRTRIRRAIFRIICSDRSSLVAETWPFVQEHTAGGADGKEYGLGGSSLDSAKESNLE